MVGVIFMDIKRALEIIDRERLSEVCINMEWNGNQMELEERS